MVGSFGTVAIAGLVWAAAMALPTAAHAKDAPATVTATARAEVATPKVKRTRKAQQVRRVASVAAPAPYHSQCFLFWCSGGRSFNFLVLGVGY